MITPVLCAVPNRAPGAPKLSGPIAGIRLQPGSLLHSIYGRELVVEEHFCNYEVNPEYVAQFEATGLLAAAWGPQGELKAMERPGHRFHLAMLYQPQLSSQPGKPHPVVIAYCRQQHNSARAAPGPGQRRRPSSLPGRSSLPE